MIKQAIFISWVSWVSLWQKNIVLIKRSTEDNGHPVTEICDFNCSYPYTTIWRFQHKIQLRHHTVSEDQSRTES